MCWGNIHKWIVRYGDETNPDFDELEQILSTENITTITGNGNNALHLASVSQSSQILTRLLEIAPLSMVNALNDIGETPLHWACGSGSISHVQLLVNAGADCHALDDESNSILHFAAQAGNLPVTRFILKKNLCPTECTNIFNQTPLAVACEEQEFRIIRALARSGASTTVLLRHYVGINEPKIVKELLKGDTTKVENEKRQNPLHLAVAFDHYKVAKVLLQVNRLWKQQADKNGNTPANLLQNSSDVRLAKLLAA